MFINPISMNQNVNLNSRKLSSQTFGKGINPEVARNQYKILLTQDIWADKLKVKRPENPLEKEVLIEVLQNRAKLDRFARLNNMLANLKTKVSYINTLFEQDPKSPELPGLIKEVEKQGNLESVYNTLHKQIQLEAAKNKPALEYFKNIGKLEDEYLEKRLMKYHKMDKFWYQIQKNNINPDGKYSTKDLISMISEESIPAAEATVEKTGPLSKKQLLDKMGQQYEEILLEHLNIYSRVLDHTKEAYNAKKILAENNVADLKRFPDIAKTVGKICTAIENKLTYKADRLGNIDIYPIGEIFDDMKHFKSEMKSLMKDIEILKDKVKNNPDDIRYKVAIAQKKVMLGETKSNWLKGLKYSVEYEKINKQRMVEGQRGAEYDFLTSKSRELNEYKKYYEIMNENDGKLPDEAWEQLLSNSSVI